MAAIARLDKGKQVARTAAQVWRATSVASEACRPASRSLSSSVPRRLPPPPAAVSSNASNIMADEAQLGRHFYLNKALEHWASRQSTKMTLRQLLFFGRSLGRDPDKILRAANYVREELPIRIAQRIRDMQDLPFVVMTNEHLEKVYQLYWRAFDRFRRWPVIVTHEDNAKFVSLLKELLEDHLTVIPSLALGVVEVSDHLPPGQLEAFMQRMLKSRISRRVLAEQHIALSEALDDPFAFFSTDSSEESSSSSLQPEESIGIIHTHLSVRAIVQESIQLLTNVFAREAGLTPEEAIREKKVPEMVIDGDLDARISYIPEHISFIVFELIKDAMRAVMRLRPEERDDIPLRATIVEGPPEDDLIIRISDCGGGVSDLVSRLANAPKKAETKSAPAAPRPPPTMPRTTVGKEGGAVASSTSDVSPLVASESAVDGALLNDSPFGFGLGSSLDQQPPSSWPAGATSPVRSSASSSLTDVLCSFSNVRRRLELEDEARREEDKMQLSARRSAGTAVAEARGAGDADTTLGHHQASSRERPAASTAKGTTSTLLGASAQAGLGSRSKLDQLRRVGKFKGTVGEQIVHAAAATDSTSNQGGIHWASSSSGDLSSALSSASLGLADTGLGLPMARVLAEYFGGSLNFRSLDGHGQDVYVRLAKLSSAKEVASDLDL